MFNLLRVYGSIYTVYCSHTDQNVGKSFHRLIVVTYGVVLWWNVRWNFKQCYWSGCVKFQDFPKPKKYKKVWVNFLSEIFLESVPQKKYITNTSRFPVTIHRFRSLVIEETLPVFEPQATVPFRETGCHLRCRYFKTWDLKWNEERKSNSHIFVTVTIFRKFQMPYPTFCIAKWSHSEKSQTAFKQYVSLKTST